MFLAMGGMCFDKVDGWVGRLDSRHQNSIIFQLDAGLVLLCCIA